MPVRVLAASDDEALSVTLMENLAREGLSEADALRAVEALQDTYGWGVRRIARATGRTAGWISALLTVARSGPERAAVEQGRIGIETAVRLARLRESFPEARQSLLARLAAGEAVQIQDVPRLRHLQSADGAAPAAPLPPPGRDGGAGEGQALTAAEAASGGRDGTAGDQVAGTALEVELAQTERSLVRNLRLVTRQVLSSLVAAWTEQGPEQVLPESVRQDLRQVCQDITDVLERPSGPAGPRRLSPASYADLTQTLRKTYAVSQRPASRPLDCVFHRSAKRKARGQWL